MRLFMRGLAVPPLSVTASTCTLLFFCAFSLPAQEILPAVRTQHLAAAPSQHTLSLDPLTDQELASQALIKDEKTPRIPASFREFGAAQANQLVEPKRLTLRFAAAATLTRIESTPDFKLEQGGTCLEGNTYPANATCTLMVRFTPQGPGRRNGKLAISSTADVTPLYVGIGGFGYAPSLSFTPSIITTVPGTFASGVGVLSNAGNLAVDGGDALYIADTGNKVIRYYGVTGILRNLTVPVTLTDPRGITIDPFTTIFLSQDNPASILVSTIFGDYGLYDAGTKACAYGATCALSEGAALNAPGGLASDPGGSVFLADYNKAFRLVPVEAADENYIPLSDFFSYNELNENSGSPIAVDANDTIYAFANGSPGPCYLSATPYAYAVAGTFLDPTLLAGGNACGFGGDGGQARGAVIGNSVGQMAFDQAGNFYFTDTGNNRVRRIDAATGIITTIAGNGIAGYVGDGGPSTNAELSAPTGLAVDSQGQVYIISSSSSTGTAQVVRKVGITGALTITPTIVGTPSAVQTVTVANTGNATLNFAHVGFTSGATTDFAIDPNTTSCIFTSPLASGQSCKVGIIFTPTTTGNRIALLTMADNTVTGLNTIQVNGGGYTTATLTPATLTFASTTVGASTAAQTAVLKNTGKAALTIGSIAFSGTGATSYSDSTTCSTTTALAVGASCNISILFKPTAAGSLPAALTVSDNAYTVRQTITLAGAGVAAAKAAITPANTTFATQMTSTSSPAKILTLTNPASTALTISSWTMSGADAADWSQTRTCGSSVAPASSCTVSVVFSPVAAGSRTGTLTAATSAGPLTASLVGNAATPTTATFTPAALTFPNTAIGSVSAAQTATLTNTGTAVLDIASISLSGAENKSYSETTTCSATLAPGAHCTITVTFSPTLTGTNRVTLSVADNTAAVHQNVALTGVGQTAGTTSLLKVSRQE